MSRVFIADQSVYSKDLSSLDRYGELVVVAPSPHGESKISPLSTVEVMNHLQSVIGDFNPDEDYFVIAGQLLWVALISMYLGTFSKVKMLCFDAKAGAYVPRVANLEMVE